MKHASLRSSTLFGNKYQQQNSSSLLLLLMVQWGLTTNIVFQISYQDHWKNSRKARMDGQKEA